MGHLILNHVILSEGSAQSKDLRRAWSFDGRVLAIGTPARADVLPTGVEALDQCGLFRSSPAFGLSFSCRGLVRVREFFEIDEAVDVVFGGEPSESPIPMLVHSPFEIVGHADVKRPRVT